MRVRGEPEPEVLVRRSLSYSLHYLFQGIHPRLHEMTVGKKDPVSILRTRRYQSIDQGGLSLSQRKRLKLVLHVKLCCYLEESCNRVCSWTEDKDERNAAGALGINKSEVEGGRLHKPRAKIVNDKRSGRKDYAVGAD